MIHNKQKGNQTSNNSTTRDAVNKLAEKIFLNKFWVNGSFLINELARNKIINKLKAEFNF